MTSKANWQDLEDILADLKEGGYKCEFVLESSSEGYIISKGGKERVVVQMLNKGADI